MSSSFKKLLIAGICLDIIIIAFLAVLIFYSESSAEYNMMVEEMKKAKSSLHSLRYSLSERLEERKRERSEEDQGDADGHADQGQHGYKTYSLPEDDPAENHNEQRPGGLYEQGIGDRRPDERTGSSRRRASRRPRSQGL